MTPDLLAYQFQPIVDLGNLNLIRQEALVRIEGVSDVEAFIRNLESRGAIIELDLHGVAQAANLLDNASGRPVPVALNISAHSLDNLPFQHELLSWLDTMSDPSRVSLEITETAPIRNLEGARRLTDRIKGAGCTIGLDDYGAGFAELHVVDGLHLDYLKLSSALTTKVLTSEPAQQTVREAICFAEGLGLAIVAEHVDNEAQLAWLRQEGISHGQGWLFGRAGELITEPEVFSAELRARLGA